MSPVVSAVTVTAARIWMISGSMPSALKNPLTCATRSGRTVIPRLG
jgi:hypothetical protein